jgi:hypothetical protein
MPRRLALALSAPVAIAVVVLAGCSTGSPSAQNTVGSATTAKPTASATPAVAATGTTPEGTETAAPATTVLNIAPGSSVTLSGTGCKPDAQVAIFAAASHASGRTLGQVAADASGGFSITVTVPYMGEPEATLSAMCDNTAGTTTAVTQRTVKYTSAG